MMGLARPPTKNRNEPVTLALKCTCGHTAVISIKLRMGQIDSYGGVCPVCSQQYVLTVERKAPPRKLRGPSKL